MISELVWQTFTSEFDSHEVPLSYGLVPHLIKQLSKLIILYSFKRIIFVFKNKSEIVLYTVISLV